MRYLIFTFFVCLLILLFSFGKKSVDIAANEIGVITADSVIQPKDSVAEKTGKGNTLFVTRPPVQALTFVEYAKTLTGTPYLYGSTDPAKGLDCSGFINAVSKHFGIKVPRSSVEFTNVGTTVGSEQAQPGDLVLFTGTNPARRVVGHIGIITDNNDGKIKFIHSSSGKAKGVTVSDLDKHYQQRFVKVIRIFPVDTGKVVA